MMDMMELLTINLRFVTVLSLYYFKISLAVSFARKIFCVNFYVAVYVLSVTDYAQVRVPRLILFWAQKYFKPTLLWDDTLQRGTLK